ncbi:hypothetical protein POM88_011328 [Heracleum sosnowskyi]|uniref:Uncharacterized protein n=1 Tax=Heracleum sosnowskyi TaxID=360622 RepID=A0AAD8IUA8_9APIA|nr:hypothetical protein POM88_011328 [Heracleum sosnowskyi]
MDERGRLEAEKNMRDVHSKAVDDVLYLNSLLTFAVFIGLSQASPGVRSLENRDEYNASPGFSKKLIVFEVLAFALFLLSSLFVKALKLHISLDFHNLVFVTRGLELKDWLLMLTAGTSVAGIILLIASVVCLVQIQIGLFSCGSTDSRVAILGVCTIVSISMLLYFVSISIGIYASHTNYGVPLRRPKREISGADTVPPQLVLELGRDDELV